MPQSTKLAPIHKLAHPKKSTTHKFVILSEGVHSITVNAAVEGPAVALALVVVLALVLVVVVALAVSVAVALLSSLVVILRAAEATAVRTCRCPFSLNPTDHVLDPWLNKPVLLEGTDFSPAVTAAFAIRLQPLRYGFLVRVNSFSPL